MVLSVEDVDLVLNRLVSFGGFHDLICELHVRQRLQELDLFLRARLAFASPFQLLKLWYLNESHVSENGERSPADHVRNKREIQIAALFNFGGVVESGQVR